MAIIEFECTFCASTCSSTPDELGRLIGSPATRVSMASANRTDHRAFWTFMDGSNELFEEVFPRIVKWATSYSKTLKPIQDAMYSLWCTLHTDSEFAGVAFEASDMKALGDAGISLVISAHTQAGDEPSSKD
jgi:hypothetical protein